MKFKMPLVALMMRAIDAVLEQCELKQIKSKMIGVAAVLLMARGLSAASMPAEQTVPQEVTAAFADMGVRFANGDWMHCDEDVAQEADARDCAWHLSLQEVGELESFVKGLPTGKMERDAVFTQILINARPARSESALWVEDPGVDIHPSPSGMRMIPAIIVKHDLRRLGSKQAAPVSGVAQLAIPAELAKSLAAFNPDGSDYKTQNLDVPASFTNDAKFASLAAPLAAHTFELKPPSQPDISASSSPEGEKQQTFEDRAYKYSMLAFHIAGAFDLASTIYGIRHLPFASESNPVFLKIFGQGNDRNILLISAGWLFVHVSAQVLAHYVFEKAKEQARKGHQGWRIFLDSLALGLIAVGIILHIVESATWYGPGML